MVSVRQIEIVAPSVDGVAGVRTAQVETKAPGFLQLLQQYEQRWDSIEQRSTQQLRRLSPEHAQLFAVQRDVSAVALETELISRAADAVSSSLRKLQQLHSPS